MIFTVSEKKNQISSFCFCFHSQSPSQTFVNPRSGRENRQWPPFQLGGVTGVATPFKRREKALVTALGFSPACHKMSPDTKAPVLVSAHSHSTANKCDLLFFFPPTTKRKEKKKNLTHLYLASWNKINKWKQCALQLCQTRTEVIFFSLC